MRIFLHKNISGNLFQVFCDGSSFKYLVLFCILINNFTNQKNRILCHTLCVCVLFLIGEVYHN